MGELRGHGVDPNIAITEQRGGGGGDLDEGGGSGLLYGTFPLAKAALHN